MRVLYSAVGDTDPTRNGRDGGILHIIRHYHPQKAILFLSAEMSIREKKNGLYSNSIKQLAPNCEIKMIESGLINVHRLDELEPLLSEFIKVMAEHKEDEILLNLSSGTPQMKMIMSILSVEYPQVKGIQVDTPAKKSNGANLDVKNDAEAQESIEVALDEEPYEPSRCSEPHLTFIRRYKVKQELLALIKAYEYRRALHLYQENAALFENNEKIRMVLEHLHLRSSDTITAAKKVVNKDLFTHDNLNFDGMTSYPDFLVLNEFFMVMQLRLKSGELPDFVIKISPFMTEVLRKYIEKKIKFPLEKFLIKDKNRKMERLHIQEISKFPNLAKALNINQTIPNGAPLSFWHLKALLTYCCEENHYIKDEQIRKNALRMLTIANQLREAEEMLRNKVAHQIVKITEADFSITNGSKGLLKKLDEFFRNAYVQKNTSGGTGFVYDQFNKWLEMEINK